MILRKMLLITFLIILTTHITDGKVCRSTPVLVTLNDSAPVLNVTGTNETVIEESFESVIQLWNLVTCPKPTEPATHTECCKNNNRSSTEVSICCPAAGKSFYDNTLVTVIAATVIVMCVILSILAVVCCFWSKCPLYDTCRAHYEQSEVITLGKDDETMGMNNMPAEPNNKNKHIYAPNNINTGSAV